ncbi:hypothetical protein V6439_002375 [Vibrio parahaemolyticus]
MTEKVYQQENTTKAEIVHSTKLERLKYTIFILSFYTYFAGALYFYGMMSSLGFKGASLDSVFSPLVYSQYFAADILSKTFILRDFKALLFPLNTALIVTSLVFVSALVIHFKLWERVSSQVGKKYKYKKPLVRKNLPMMSLLTFPMMYLGQLLTVAALVSLISMMAIPLFAPYVMGESAGKKILERNNGEVCRSFDWKSEEYKTKNIVLSCERIRVNKSGKTVSGTVIHTDPKFVYAITNDLLIRVKDDQVISCTTKQYKKEKKVGSLALENEVNPISCEELYLSSSEEVI